MPELSVVIPLYNKESYIARSLNSVLHQTIQDFEVIVVDDGSTDNGARVVQRFNDTRLRLIQQKNQGVSAARNRGINAANADLVAFLDADDEWLPEFIETILRLRKLYPDAGLFGTAYEVHFPGANVQRVFVKNNGDRILLSYFGATVMFESNLFNSSSFAAPKDVLVSVGGYLSGVKWNEDGMLWGKIALQFPVAYSPDICSIYHQYSENSSMGILEYLENPFLQYISTIPREDLEKRNDIGDLLEYCDHCHLATCFRNIYSGYGRKARSELYLVKSHRYTLEKYKLLFYSCIPSCIFKIIRTHEKIISILKRKILFK